MRGRSVRLALATFTVGWAAVLASAQPPQGWGGPRVIHYKICARCGYKTEDQSITVCPNCSGRGVEQPRESPSFRGYEPSSTAALPAERKEGLSLNDNIRLGVTILVGSTILLTVFFGGFFMVNYLLTTKNVRKAQKPATRRRRYEDDDE